MKRADNDVGIALELEKLFDIKGFYAQPFQGLQSHHLQMKYFKENFGLLVWVKVSLSFLATPLYNRNQFGTFLVRNMCGKDLVKSVDVSRFKIP